MKKLTARMNSLPHEKDVMRNLNICVPRYLGIGVNASRFLRGCPKQDFSNEVHVTFHDRPFRVNADKHEGVALRPGGTVEFLHRTCPRCGLNLVDEVPESAHFQRRQS